MSEQLNSEPAGTRPEHETSSEKLDFAHEATGFLTWHRQMLLWLEYEIQQKLNSHTFRLPFWDWTDSNERTNHFIRARLGQPRSTDFVVEGELFANWSTICWNCSQRGPDGEDCNPTDTSLARNCPLKRCPTTQNGVDPCRRNNKNWPSAEDVKVALDIRSYDNSAPLNGESIFGVCSQNSFRNFLEGFEIKTCDRSEDEMCSNTDVSALAPCDRTRKLHNSVHIILGASSIRTLGEKNVQSNEYIDVGNLGVMSHVAASPNDPIFINHHAMIDCIFDEWLKRNPDASYPDVTTTSPGHKGSDYIVPFLPAFNHSSMFKLATNFGYKCNLNHITNGGGDNGGGDNGGGGNGGGDNGGGDNGGGGNRGGGNGADMLRPFGIAITLSSISALILTIIMN